jgi:colanic acid/amylovoran biosynthesis glycosyltransferase
VQSDQKIYSLFTVNFMPTIAYLANEFPSATEPYVRAEIEELRSKGAKVIAGSVRKPDSKWRRADSKFEDAILCLQPIRLMIALKAIRLAVVRWGHISRFIKGALVEGSQSPPRRVKALLHTWLGAYYALLLRKYDVDHIHVHHGYFGSWIGMVAASLLEIDYSLTLHGSDLLIHDAYLDTKLSNCKFCLTVSEFNRRYILKQFPTVKPEEIMVSRLGVDTNDSEARSSLGPRARKARFSLLSVGRLQAVKNHAFLVRACSHLRNRGLDFECAIAGAGPERRQLQALIDQNRLNDRVKLLGHISHSQMEALYHAADLLVLTSISEGIPLVLMEAMACGTLVLAPAITGIPELVIPGRTGFLYPAGDLEQFVQRVSFLHHLQRPASPALKSRLNWIRHAERVQVRRNFHRGKNLAHFGTAFLKLVAPKERGWFNENSVLQQI